MSKLTFKVTDIVNKDSYIIDNMYFFEEAGIREVVDGIGQGAFYTYKIEIVDSGVHNEKAEFWKNKYNNLKASYDMLTTALKQEQELAEL